MAHIADQRQDRHPPFESDVDPTLQEIIDCAMAYDANLRYSASGFAQARLLLAISGE